MESGRPNIASVTDSTCQIQNGDRALHPTPLRQSRYLSIGPLLLLLALINLATKLLDLPLNRVIELRYCQAYYKSHDPSFFNGSGDTIDEGLCKVNEIQQNLAWLQGIINTVVFACDLIVTIPFGFIASRFGRRFVLGICVISQSLMYMWYLLVGHLRHLPVEAMVAGAFLPLFGGGDCVITATTFAFITDIAQDLVQRTEYFAYVSSVAYVISMCGPLLAAITMGRNLWLPFWLAIGLLISALPVVYTLPKRPLQDRKRRDSNSHESIATERSWLLGDEALLESASTYEHSRKRRVIYQILHEFHAIAHSVVGRQNFQILLAGFILTSVASASSPILILYISKRYHWNFSSVGYFLSMKAVVNVSLLIVIVPKLMRASLRRINASEVHINFYAAEISLLISVIGVLSIAMAWKRWMLISALLIYALGSALPVFTISLIKSPVVSRDQESTNAYDYSIIVLTKTLGTFLGAPLMTIFWVKGIELSGIAIGFPFYISAVFYLIALLVISQLRF